MKLAFNITNFKPMLGYTNIDLIPDEQALQQKLVIKGKPTDLDFIPNQLVEEIQINYILSTLTPAMLDKAIQIWKSKLIKGGVILLSDIDMVFITNQYVNNEITNDQMNFICYGNQQLPRVGLHTLLSVEEAFKKHGFTTEIKTYLDVSPYSFFLKVKLT